LHAVRSSAPDIAVVVLTGWGDESVGTAAVAAGAQDYLIKGEATPPTIARSIRFAIERKRNELSTAMLLRAQLRNVERERLERALLATPSFRRADFSWATKYTAARTGVVSGDFIDGVELPDGSIRAIIGDVAGHGPDEAALGVSLRAGWRALVLSAVEPELVLASLEDLLLTERSTGDAYATVCEITISPNLRQVVVRSAGHPPPVLAGVGALVDSNLRSPLGMQFGHRRWLGTTFDLPEVWSIALYTDGLFEIRSDDGDILSIDDVPGAVDNSVVDDFIDPDLLLERFASQSAEGWRDDVALAVISSRAWGTS
jgi:serine phosphatase RsbU (regulator of sigma subunit)